MSILYIRRVWQNGNNILKDNDIDVDASIEILGDLEMYNETLKDFYDLSEEKLEKIENAKNNNDLNSYSIEVHALKVMLNI